MKYRVELHLEAELDLIALHAYIADHGAPDAADRTIERLLAACRTLERYPRRGRVVPEAADWGDPSYREIARHPHRIIYEIEGSRVLVLAVLDGRRNIAAALRERLAVLARSKD
jgi:toxin ParE1/3/4